MSAGEETTPNGADVAPLPPCGRCGHPPDWHRLDSASNVSPNDPEAQFRCLGYDCEADGPPPPYGRACWCHDYSDVFVQVRQAHEREPGGQRMSDTPNSDAVWCPADACPVSICGGPHISHVCNGDDVATMRWDMRCPLCGWEQEKNP